MGHDHQHATGRVLAISLAATVLFVVIELLTGVWSGSLALISDAGHNFTDALALLLAMFGVWLQSKPSDETKTYGYHRGGVLAAFVNALALVLLSGYLLWESYERLRSPQAVNESAMIVVAGLGLALNAGILLGLRRAHTHDLNIRAASIHMMGDALGSVAIIIGAIGIRYTGWLAVDPVLSILISVLIIWTAVDIIRDSLNILLEGLPKGMQLQNVVGAIKGVPGVLDVHDVHIWSLGSTAHALSCHARIPDVPPSESWCILKGINDMLAARFHISHTTIQFEHEHCGVAEGPCCIQPVARAHAHEHQHAH
ncbi:MAG TPA: cation diffusion facilitator family transporter [Bryobacteraceae bacterium]|nr:cation diffusion facilitator family transporter [Bryobacteraceae bacterium]